MPQHQNRLPMGGVCGNTAPFLQPRRPDRCLEVRLHGVASYIAFESRLSGMSTNPARRFGPALYGSYWRALWIYFTAQPAGILAAAEVFLLARGRRDPYCAKLHHHNDKRCIFRHSGRDPTAPSTK